VVSTTFQQAEEQRAIQWGVTVVQKKGQKEVKEEK
jgi:hypothetical protein